MANGLVNGTPFITLPQSGGIGPYLRVLMDPTQSPPVLKLAGATDREIGTTDCPVPASGLGSDPNATIDDRKAAGTVRMVAAGAISIYGRVYGAANGLVSATPNGNFIGYAVTSATANGDWIEVDRASDDQTLLFSSLAASAVLTNLAVETDFGLDFTIPANQLRPGDVVEIMASGAILGVTGTPTMTLKLYLGTQVLVATAAVTVTNAGLFLVKAQCVVETAGTGGTFGARGVTTLGVPGTAVPTPFRLVTTTTLNTTLAQLVKLTGTWSAANASNQAILDLLTVKRLAF